MTATRRPEAPASVPGKPPVGAEVGAVPAPLFLDPCLARLAAAIQAARSLGVAVADAEAVASDAASRLGFPSDTYVLALAGGTGVGKSSVLNGLAGHEVSPASVRRPTTSAPIAWVPGGAADRVAELLDWLGVAPGDVRAADEAAGADLAILDLPDLDSIEVEHRRRVDELLPRVDAVIWVTDPEKYHDALVHEEILARWLPRLGRQLIVVNKVDRVAPGDAERIRRDLERDVARIAGPAANARAGGGPGRPQVVLASASPDRADGDGLAGGGLAGDGLAGVRRWLDEGVDAKQVVRGRLIATIRDTIDQLARGAGIDPTGPARPILSPADRAAAADRATAALLRAVDVDSARRQAVAATRARARSRGAGPLGAVTSRLFRWSGRQARVADPAGYLARWRDRGSAEPAAAELRSALAQPLRQSPPGTRRLIAESADQEILAHGLAAAVDRAVHAGPGAIAAPSSRWWTVIGLAQTIATAAIVLAAIWVGLWIVIRFPADEVVLPALGRIPIPFVALVLALGAGYVLARLLGAHAGWLGRRWADTLAARIAANVRAEVATSAFVAVDRVDASRRALWSAARGAAEDCRPASAQRGKHLAGEPGA